MRYYASKLSENMAETPEGYLLCVGVSIGRVGEMDYARGECPIAPGPDGLAKVTRSQLELFRAETIASFEGKPLTVNHPNEFVDPGNWKQLTKGILQNVRRGDRDQDQDLVADILITDADAISLVKAGLREVSCGYEAEYIETGVGRGEQKNIIGNHLALVEEGRAGATYAIKDSKGVLRMNKKLADKIKSMFSKVIDEAAASEEVPGVDKSPSYDELVKVCNAMSEKLDKMSGAKDAEKPVEKKEEKPAPEKSGDEEGANPLEARLAKLEAAVQKLLGAQDTGDADEDGDDDEEAEDGMTGDTAARAEILSPGIELTKDVKAKSLESCYQTKDGKKAIDALTAGKPDFKDESKVEMLFIAASELLKNERGQEVAKTRQHRTSDEFPSSFSAGHMTAEKMNEMNAKHYGPKQ